MFKIGKNLILASSRPQALLLTPIVPDITGNGLAMRAAAIAQALADITELRTVVVPVSVNAADTQMHWIKKHSVQAAVLRQPNSADAMRAWLNYPQSRRLVATVPSLPQRARAAAPVHKTTLAKLLQHNEFQFIYVLRLYLAGTVVPLLEQYPHPQAILDIDEDDAMVSRALADLQQSRGHLDSATQLRAEAIAYDRFAAACLPWFDTVVTASETETQAMRKRYPSYHFATVVNAISTTSINKDHATHLHQPQTLQIIFVGNLNYQPNVEAVERLVKHVLPIIKDQLPKTQLTIVGAGNDHSLAVLGHEKDVTVCGYVDDLQAEYKRASLTVIPLSAGGGSRLKVLEAFAYNIPVVATPTAVAGLDVRHNQHLLIADTDAELAQAACSIAHDSCRRQRLTSHAATFVKQHHSFHTIFHQLAKLVSIPDQI